MERKLPVDALPVLIYLLLNIAFFLPVVLNPTYVFMGSFADITVPLMTPAYLRYNMENGINSLYTDRISAPFGAEISGFGGYIFSLIYFALPISIIASPLVAQNMLMFFGPLLSAIAAYFLARHFIKDRHACFTAGLIYGFSPYIMSRVLAEHFNLSQAGFLAFFVLALFRFNEKKSYLNAFLLSLTLVVTGWFDYYYLYFAAIFTVIFYLYKFWGERRLLPGQLKGALTKPLAFIKEKKYYLAAALVFVVLFSATLLPLYIVITSHADTSVYWHALGGRTNLMSHVYLSTWPYQFITPSVNHPLLRGIIGDFLSSTLVGMNTTNATVFIGFTALALSLFALARKKENPYVRFFLFAAVSVLILATGPFMRYIPFFGLTLTFVPALLAVYCLYLGKTKLAKIFAALFVALLFFSLLYSFLPLIQGPAAELTHLEQLKTASVDEIVEHLEKYEMLPIPMPSFFIFLMINVFRSVARLDILFMLCIAMLSGFGMSLILERVKSVNKKMAITLLVSALILFEVLTFPPYIATDVSETPPEYVWLASLPGDSIVVEYPLEWENFYIVYQLWHMKPLMNGSHNSKTIELKSHILDPTQYETLSLLSGIGVEYLIVHDSFFSDSIPDYFPEKRSTLRWVPTARSVPFSKKLYESSEAMPGLQLVQLFPHAKVFRITAEPKEFEFGSSG